ncbi:UDP-N-acetylmuramoyl-L-alanyl-D-glutamate--2,6-diaminopimelate ligase [Marinobacter salicampi]|uniref:UDP-N-acetylmuramoyl-L-alanyl-D-glutamate--2, 6-diaminopimelate ligase n=1 Tax=Marinobacter salicampi TaxID=435907 RepID=UPI0014092588|nr:UDP-N-acetylmuramoyl-L-alanyl-D-glutamate--2,6-diaminopimelate ligase [Marinobacter salicampi]
MSITSLSTLLQGIASVPSVFDVTIHGLTTDSREVRSGDAFVAISGANTPADHYVEAAIRSGATVILLEADASGECEERLGALVVPVVCLKERLGLIADRFYEHPSQRLRVLGVTGTNGKTSVSHYVAQLLSDTGYPCGLMGTLGYGMLGRLSPASHTTPDVVSVNRNLAHIHSQGGRTAVMEVSSHALEQGRIDGVRIAGAIFTNLTRDHLDYHGSMEAYGSAKARLFAREELHFAVLNFDDPFGQQLYEQLEGRCDRIRYSLHEAQTELWLTSLEVEVDGFTASLDGLWGKFTVSAPLLGTFNISNLLAATGAVLSLGVPVERVIQATRRLSPPPGRLESYMGSGGVQVVVDYAHTPDALKNALAALRQHVHGSLICVFGCGGDRDSGKRPDMAREAEAAADRIFITDDNPRSERPEAIVSDIIAGFSRPERVQVIHDRADAIRTAVSQAEPGDVVLVAGKGHESWQEMSGQRILFSDAEQVRSALALTGGVA